MVLIFLIISRVKNIVKLFKQQCLSLIKNSKDLNNQQFTNFTIFILPTQFLK